MLLNKYVCIDTNAGHLSNRHVISNHFTCSNVETLYLMLPCRSKDLVYLRLTFIQSTLCVFNVAVTFLVANWTPYFKIELFELAKVQIEYTVI